MTDESSEPSPETDAVRRLLAEARHDEPMPADVAARMDRVLADLAAETGPVETGPLDTEEAPAEPSPTGAIVTELPVQRRRRAAALLAAAAAIVVGGVVLAQHLPHQSTAAQESAGADTAGGTMSTPSPKNSQTRVPAARPTPQAGSGPSAKPVIDNGQVVVRRDTFAADALAARSLLSGHRVQFLDRTGPPCPTTSGGDQVLAALYRHAPAALVYHQPDGSTQVVDLVVCGSHRPIESVTLPAP